MTATVYTTDSRQSLRQAVAQHFARCEAGRSRVLIVPDSGSVEAWRQFFAQESPQLAFNMKVVTMRDYIDEKWVLFGDGRTISRPTLGRIVMIRTLVDMRQAWGDDAPVVTPGTVDMLQRVASMGMGIPSFDSMLQQAPDLGTSQLARYWQVVAHYRDVLHDAGLVEYGEALAVLATVLPDNVPEVAAGFDSLKPAEVMFLKSRGATLFVERGGNDPAFASVDEFLQRFQVQPVAWSLGAHDNAGAACSLQGQRPAELEQLLGRVFCPGKSVQPSGNVQFAFASGVYAEPPLVADIIGQHVQNGVNPGDIYVVSKALPQHFECQQMLARQGIPSVGSDSRTVAQTGLGKAFVALACGQKTKTLLADFVLSPFSGISRRDAYWLDRSWRTTRAVSFEDALASLQQLPGLAHAIADARVNGQYERAVELMIMAYESHLERLHGAEHDGDGDQPASSDSTEIAGGAERGQLNQLDEGLYASRKAADKIKAIVYFGNELGLTPDDMQAMFDIELCSVRYEVPPQQGTCTTGTGCVEFGSMSKLASRQCSVVVLAGLTAEAFPVHKDPDAGEKMLQQAGIEVHEDYLDKQRYRLYQALSSVQGTAVLERRLHNQAGDEERPSVLMEEVTDCYRADIDDFDSLQKGTLLPSEIVDAQCGVQLVHGFGESDIADIVERPAYASPDAAAFVAPVIDRMPQFPVGVAPRQACVLSDEQYSQIAQMALGLPEQPKPLSPTAIELYMRCPYRWFIERKVSPEPLDAQLDQLALGSLRHGALMRFYQRLRQRGRQRVDGMRRDDIMQAAHECCVSYIQEEVEANPQSPFAQMSRMEQKQVEECARQVGELLCDDAAFMRDFVPTHFEQKIVQEDGFVYAGHPFVGTIDRVDIDQAGRAAIIDYKGALDQGFSVELGAAESGADGLGEPVQPPEHIQAMVYATAAQRQMGLQVSAAVYRSYSHRREVAGICDLTVVGPKHMFSSKFVTGFSQQQLQELLDHTEDRVRQAIARLAQGDIAPEPLSVKSCAYCKAVGCDRRLAK